MNRLFIFLASAAIAQTVPVLVTPCRLADTRDSSYGTLGPPSLVAGQTRTLNLLASPCLPAGPAYSGYMLNVAVVPKPVLAYLTIWPAGQSMPLSSVLNAPTGIVTANNISVPAGANGAISVYAPNNTDLVIDLYGYYVPGAAGPAGPTGATGSTGAAGPTGATGATGNGSAAPFTIEGISPISVVQSNTGALVYTVGLAGYHPSPPATSRDSCAAGDWAQDVPWIAQPYYYYCVAANTWKRALLPALEVW